MSVQEISVILKNLNFLTLIEPFRRNGVSGKAMNRIKSCDEIMEFDNVNIRRVVAETFFEDFLQEWKSTGLVPKCHSVAPSFVPLKDMSVQDTSVILKNLSFLSLIEPFRRNGVSGKAMNRIKSCEDIMDFDYANIRRVVAETFFEDYLQEWKSTGLVPKDLL
jgi:hypothetical protein